MKYKAIIFDLDGTLLNTLEDLANSMNHVLKSQGLPVHEVEEYKYLVGKGMYNLAQKALPPEKREDKVTPVSTIASGVIFLMRDRPRITRVDIMEPAKAQTEIKIGFEKDTPSSV